HTRFSRDWSSDVCSSDLAGDAGVVAGASAGGADRRRRLWPAGCRRWLGLRRSGGGLLFEGYRQLLLYRLRFAFRRDRGRRYGGRSEERRVGKEWRERSAR